MKAIRTEVLLAAPRAMPVPGRQTLIQLQTTRTAVAAEERTAARAAPEDLAGAAPGSLGEMAASRFPSRRTRLSWAEAAERARRTTAPFGIRLPILAAARRRPVRRPVRESIAAARRAAESSSSMRARLPGQGRSLRTGRTRLRPRMTAGAGVARAELSSYGRIRGAFPACRPRGGGG